MTQRYGERQTDSNYQGEIEKDGTDREIERTERTKEGEQQGEKS